jgi:hypothetical protein
MRAIIKNLIIVVSMCFWASTSFAQIPNPSFEEINANGSLRNWGNLYIQPVWFDTTGEMQGDSIIIDNAYYSATSDAHNGNWAAEMRNSFNYSQNTGTAGAIIADLDSVYTAWGSFETFPIENSPTALGFFYKHNPVNGDSASAQIIVFDSLGLEIGFGSCIISNFNNAYFYNTAQITYTTQDVPAYAMVKFSNFYTEAPGVRQPSLGSSFIVDDVQLYTSTGFDLISRKQLDVMVYPNPSADLITIRRNTNEIAQVNIYQLNGQLLKCETICRDVSEIDLRNLSNGAYLLEVISDGKTRTQQLIVQH